MPMSNHGEMAGRSPKDRTPRNTHTIQICLPEKEYQQVKSYAAQTEYGSASVWLRHYLREQGIVEAVA